MTPDLGSPERGRNGGKYHAFLDRASQGGGDSEGLEKGEEIFFGPKPRGIRRPRELRTEVRDSVPLAEVHANFQGAEGMGEPIPISPMGADSMFSSLLQFFRWTVILGIAATLTLSALLFQVRYLGGGHFQILLKDRPTLSGTFLSVDPTVGGGPPRPSEIEEARATVLTPRRPRAARPPARSPAPPSKAPAEKGWDEEVAVLTDFLEAVGEKQEAKPAARFPEATPSQGASEEPEVVAKPKTEDEACAAVRWRIRKSVSSYQDKTHMPMNTLNLFALLDAEVLHEIPSCPRGGNFHKDPETGRILCAIHR